MVSFLSQEHKRFLRKVVDWVLLVTEGGLGEDLMRRGRCKGRVLEKGSVRERDLTRRGLELVRKV